MRHYLAYYRSWGMEKSDLFGLNLGMPFRLLYLSGKKRLLPGVMKSMFLIYRDIHAGRPSNSASRRA
jgi:hypothetical protein